jgi:hypothetical protein
MGITEFSSIRAWQNFDIAEFAGEQVKCTRCNLAYIDNKRFMEHQAECKEIKEVVTAGKVADELISSTANMTTMPKEFVESVVTIAESLKGISTFLSGQTLPQVMESYAIMSCLGQIMNGLTANQGRVGLDARTIKQDAIDGTHRILAAFDHLRDTFEQRKNGERTAEVVDPEADYLKWKKEQGGEG